MEGPQVPPDFLALLIYCLNRLCYFNIFLFALIRLQDKLIEIHELILYLAIKSVVGRAAESQK